MPGERIVIPPPADPRVRAFCESLAKAVASVVLNELDDSGSADHVPAPDSSAGAEGKL